MESVAITRFEVVRLFTSRRWFVAAPVWLLVAKLSADDVISYAAGAGLTHWSVFDVHAAAVNNMFYVGLLLLTTFVLIACDGLAHDRETRLAHVIVTRAGLKQRWWIAKALAVLLAAAVFQAGFLVAAVAVGAFEGGTGSPAPSSVALGATDPGSEAQAHLLFTPADADTDMLVREIGVALYQTLAFGSVGLLMLAVTSRFPVSWLPALLALGTVLLDHTLNWLIRSPWYLWVSPTTRLMEAIHSARVVSDPIPLWSSVAWFLVMGGASAAIGTGVIVRADI